MKRNPIVQTGFSLVEVAISLGIISFAMLTILALLPLGMKSNHISAEETRAACLLSLMESDLRNTHPQANGGHSQIYGFPLPYAVDASGRYLFNSSLTKTSLTDGATTGLNDREAPAPISTSARPRFQASVIYTSIPAASSTANLQARLVVNWPALPNATPADLTDPSKNNGFVEALVSFPSP